MNTNQTTPKTIDEYIAAFPNDVQEMLEKVRTTIKVAAPEAQETISYNMPTFTLNGHYLVYFAAYKRHVSLYPVPTGDAELNAEISAYVAGKGTLRFPFDQPIPFDLISRIVKVRVQADAGRAVAKGKKN